MSDLVAVAARAPAYSAASADGASARYDMAREIVSRRGLLATPQRKLIAALIVSVATHLLLGSFAEVEPLEEKFQPIKAKFVNLPPPPVAVAPVVKPTAKPKAKSKPRPAVVAESPVAIAAPEPVAERGPEPAPAPVAVADVPAAPESAPVVVPEPTPVPPPVVPPEPPARMPPKKIELAYTAFLGEQKFEVGPVNLNFTHDEGRYKLVVKGRGRGLAALNGNIYVVGRNDGAGANKGHLRKYDASGNLIWSRSAATGSFMGVTALGGAIFAVGQAGSGASANFLVEKWDEAGNLLWSQQYDRNSAEDILNAVTAFGGRIYAAGSTRGTTAGGADAALLEIDPATGNLLATTLYGGAQDDFANGIATDGTDCGSRQWKFIP